MSSPDLSLVMPVYNEALCLADSLKQVIGYLDSLDLEFELLVVDDGSHDGTAATLTAWAMDEPRLHVHSLRHNQGKGSALQLGVSNATGHVIVTLDADLSTDLDALPRALHELEAGAALVIGDRRHPDSQIPVRQPYVRERCGGLFNVLARLLVGSGIRDYTCGFKVYKRDAALELYANLEIARWAYDVELLAIARARGMRIASLPVTWSHHGDTHVRLPADGFGALMDLLRIGRRYRLGEYAS